MEANDFDEHHDQDLHELVTLEPNSYTYATTSQNPGSGQQHIPSFGNVSADQVSPSRTAEINNFQHSASIFGQIGSADANNSQSSRAPEPTHASRWPFLSTHGSTSSTALSAYSHDSGLTGNLPQAQMEPAEKDSDDVDTPSESRRRVAHGSNTATSTTLHRLFAQPLSPMASREPSFNQPLHSSGYTRSVANEPTSLPSHLYTRGLLGGRHSDINIKVFGNTYPLHRIILDRAPYFQSALSEPWREASQKDVELHPEDIDTNITRTTFELALKRLYGCHKTEEEDEEASGLFATGCWLEMQDLVDASVNSILRKMSLHNLPDVIRLVTSNYYGKPGEKILASTKAMLSRDGWEMPLKLWDGVPSELTRNVVGADGFFVYGEWERWVLAKRLLDRKLKILARDAGLARWSSQGIPSSLTLQALRPASSRDEETMDETMSRLSVDTETSQRQRWLDLYRHHEVIPLLQLLDEDIHYIHMQFEQLQFIRAARDFFGVPILPEKIIADALWSNLELRQKVLCTRDKELTLGLSQEINDESEANDAKSFEHHGSAHDPSVRNHTKRYRIPSTDCNIVLGGSSEPIITSTSNANRQASRLSSALQAPSHSRASSFTNDADASASNNQAAVPESSSSAAISARPSNYSALPPFRFSAEFPNPRALKERKRVYSRTVFYAGSLWNVYIQKVKSSSKNPQLGVYLHRAKERYDGDVSSGVVGGSVDERIGALEREMMLRRERRRIFRQTDSNAGSPLHGGEIDETSGSGGDGDLGRISSPPQSGLSTFMATGSRSRRAHVQRPLVPSAKAPLHASSSSMIETATPYLSSSSGENLSSLSSGSDGESDMTPNSVTRPERTQALPPYTDARPTIKTYFKIYSPSRGGRLLSVYESAPDNFNFSQSWGWKSSTLMVEDDADTVGLGGQSGTGFEISPAEDGLDETVIEDGTSGLMKRSTGSRISPRGLRFMVVLGVV